MADVPIPAEFSETARPYLDLAHPAHEFRSFRYVLPWIASLPVLDLGCASGSYLRHFAAGSLGVDVSWPNLARCTELGLRVIPADLNQKLPFADESFPAIFCSHVMEHVDAPIALLRECCRVLQPGGLIVLGLPIESSIVNRIRGQKYFYHHPGHLYSFTLENIDILLQKTGFRTEHCYFEPRIVPGRWWLTFMQRLPVSVAHTLALAFWVVARKRLIK
jgi:SAM-dependent methyltransferase